MDTPVHHQPSFPSRDPGGQAASAQPPPPSATKKKSRSRADPASQKRRCVSTACIACRKRKSKCDGALPSCAACASVYGTDCVYDPNSDHRRKGVYREKTDSAKAGNSTLQILIEAILNAAEDDVPEIVRRIRTCDSLDTVAEAILKEDLTSNKDDNDEVDDEYATGLPMEGERDLARKMGELRVKDGVIRYFGGTSHLIYQGDENDIPTGPYYPGPEQLDQDPVTSWSEVTKDKQLITHLLNMYWNWHYPFFTTISKKLFWRDFLKGKPAITPRVAVYCSSVLVNAMLALGCHFTDIPGAYAVPGDSRTKGDHFFAEAKRLVFDNDEFEKPSQVTTQALALMSVREAGCGREARGWAYSGMSFRMAQDVGLNLDSGAIFGDHKQKMSEEEVDARRVTFWGCYLFDKTWSNYLGRLPQIPKNSYNVPKYEVFPDEDGESWAPYADGGFDQSLRQPARTRAVGLQLSKLCEISSELLLFFYHPKHIGRSSGKSVELKKLSELHRQLEDWRKELPLEFEPKEGQLPNVILMHMFYHLQYIHLFRPFLKYSPSTSPLPPHVSPRRICTANAGFISKLMRLYKKLYNVRQICNIAVYMLHSACTIHLLNLPEKTARRDIIHGVKHLEEIAEDWLCARRTLSILSVLARKWNCELPDEASGVLKRTDEKYGHLGTAEVPSPNAPLQFTPSPPAFPHSPIQTDNGERKPLVNQLATRMGQEASATLSATLLSTVGPIPPESLQNLDMPSLMAAETNNGNLPFTQNSPWAVTDMGQPPMPCYYPAYTSLGQPSASGPTATSSSTGTRHHTPNTPYTLDGKDWFLKDSVNLQQNFESWGLGASPGASTNTNTNTNTDVNTNTNTKGMVSGDIFMFKGLQEMDMDLEGWDFDSSMTNLDMIPGLE